MRVKVVFHGCYAEITGIKEEYLEIPDKADLLYLLKELEGAYGKELTGQLIDFDENEIWSLMAVAVNGKILNDLARFDCPLNEKDEIVFLPPAMILITIIMNLGKTSPGGINSWD